MNARTYPGIDIFRVVSAILVITIHTSPLAAWSATADLLLTRDLARIAVPFFFMVTGFFVLPGTTHSLLRFLKRTALLYLFAIVLYLPINIYMRSFHQITLSALCQMLFVDGTMYHLWYLPAAMGGALISRGLYRAFGLRTALVVATLFYAIGLGGDSYYGLIAQLPKAAAAYELVFQFCDYTRNGLFFAPIFMLLGLALAKHPLRCTVFWLGSGLAVSAFLMTGEVLLCHALGWPRHDSMTVFLPPVLFFLFSLLLRLQGKRAPYAAKISMLIYILHPLIILVVRVSAELTHTEALFVTNPLVHFASVTLLSLALSCGLAVYPARWRKIRQ